MALNLDLNFPPVEGSSGPMNPQVFRAESSKGLFCSPIDVEAIDDNDDDELKLLLSSASFPQGRNRGRRNRHETVDLEASTEMPPEQTGVSITEPAAILLSLSGHSTTERASTANRNCINNQQHVDLEEINNYKRKNTMTQAAEAPLPMPPPHLTSPPKEPTFTCPLCFEPLKNPCSTFCGHIFCQSCIEACISSSLRGRKGRTCPTCRSKLPAKKSFHRVYLPNAD